MASNLTPLVPMKFSNPFTQEEFRTRVMERLKDEIVNSIRIALTTQKMFKHGDGSNLAGSVDAYVEGHTIYIHSDIPHFKYQNEGVKSHTMWYLIGKTIPIEDTKTGKVTYRKCTLKSIGQGKWIHPGTPGKHFVEMGINMAMNKFQDIYEEVQQDIDVTMAYQHGMLRRA